MNTVRVYSPQYGYLVLAPFFAEGGEAYLHRVDGRQHRGIVAKVFKPAQRPPFVAFLVELITAMTAGVPYVCRLFGPIYTRPGGEALGYLMGLVRGKPLEEVVFRWWGERIAFALKLARLFAALESRGVWVSDGHCGNIFQTRFGSPELLDLDSLSFELVTWPDGSTGPRIFPGGTIQYTARELIIDPAAPHTAKSAAWTLAVLIYRVLKDVHPSTMLKRKGDVADVDTCVQSLIFGPYTPDKWGQMTPPDYGIPREKLPGRIDGYFRQSFLFGHLFPDGRVTPAEWVEALEQWQRQRRRRAVTVGLAGATSVAAALNAAGLATPSAVPTFGAGVRARGTESRTPVVTQAEAPRPELWNALLKGASR